MPTINITQKYIDNLKNTGKRTVYFDTTLVGFIAIQYATGHVSFAVNQRVNGRLKRISLGKHPALTVKEAKAKARPLLNQMYDGIDPKAEEARKKATEASLNTTLRTILHRYQSARDLKPRTVRDQNNAYKIYLGDWLDKPIRNITSEDVEKRFLELMKTKGNSTAVKMFRYLSAVMNYAHADKVNGVRLVPENPCSVISEKRIKAPIAKRTAALDETGIFWLMDYCYNVHYHPEAKPHGVTQQGINYVLLILFTGLRRSEALELRWDDIDLEEDVFTVRNTKNGLDHRLPTTVAVKGILTNQKRLSGDLPWVFPASRGEGHMVEPRTQVEKLNRHSRVKFSLHDLRRTFATHAAIHGVDYYSIKRALNHKSQDITDDYIQRNVEVLRPALQAVEDQYFHYFNEGTGKATYDADGKQEYWNQLPPLEDELD